MYVKYTQWTYSELYVCKLLTSVTCYEPRCAWIVASNLFCSSYMLKKLLFAQETTGLDSKCSSCHAIATALSLMKTPIHQRNICMNCSMCLQITASMLYSCVSAMHVQQLTVQYHCYFISAVCWTPLACSQQRCAPSCCCSELSYSSATTAMPSVVQEGLGGFSGDLDGDRDCGRGNSSSSRSIGKQIQTPAQSLKT